MMMKKKPNNKIIWFWFDGSFLSFSSIGSCLSFFRSFYKLLILFFSFFFFINVLTASSSFHFWLYHHHLIHWLSNSIFFFLFEFEFNIIHKLISIKWTDWSTKENPKDSYYFGEKKICRFFFLTFIFMAIKSNRVSSSVWLMAEW